MRQEKWFKSAALVLCISVGMSASGCARLQPGQYEQHGYQGEAVVKQGARIEPVDWIGNFFGILEKLILWNWKIKRHNITEETKSAVDAYLKDHPELGSVGVQLNRYAPQDAWKRLVKNKQVKWPYRLFIGTFVVLIADTLLIDRIFGGDRYNPYTHTVHIHSDLPSVALHELGHAKDFSERRYKGSYALLRIVPFVDLYHEAQATKIAFAHARDDKNIPQEKECYKVLYPAYGTYVGGYLGFGFLIPVIIGHIWGRNEAAALGG